jgi:signal peptidase I
VIPEGFYLMMGDNRNFSLDSRGWGLVPREFIEGRAYFVWWSYGEDKDSHTLTGWPLIKSYLRVPFTFWTRTHWQESFSRIK